ncbi:MAG: amidohydrolase, partial [Paracoccaceae bacterium]|nr:amidohydrolase [Paracoccaceae bacterium]
MKIASAAYSLDQLPDWRAYEAKITAWVTEAAGQGADLLVFPEYGAMELASLAGMKIAGELESSMHFVAGMMGRANALHEGLARKFGVHILASGGPAQGDGPRPVNRSVFFGPTGMLGYQDKQIMIPFDQRV